jgi:hypothetical protein
MNLPYPESSGIQHGSYLWTLLICVNKEMGYGSFSTLMPYPPTEGRTVEFCNTPEGDFMGTILKVHETVRFEKCTLIQINPDFGGTKNIEAIPSIIEFLVHVNLERSSQLTSCGVPEY